MYKRWMIRFRWNNIVYSTIETIFFETEKQVIDFVERYKDEIKDEHIFYIEEIKA